MLTTCPKVLHLRNGLRTSADTVESRMRDLMVAEVDNDKTSVLSQAVQGKGQFQSDEKVVNATITKLFSEVDIAKLIGDLGARPHHPHSRTCTLLEEVQP
jgi:hypothetical protein